MTERPGAITMKGSPLTLLGTERSVGDQAPEFTAVANDLTELAFSSLRGKTVILSAVPSLDTGVCATQTRRFNEETAALGEDVVVLTISMDLPFAQSRWCGAAGLQGVQTVSDHRDAAFGTAYGVLIKELRLLARSIFVVGPAGRIQYIELVRELTDEPDYEAALAAARS